MGRRKRKHYTDEFKAEAIRLVQTTESSASQVAKDLGIPATTLFQWLQQAEVDAGKGATGKLKTDEREELARLRRDNERLRQERDFLKKAAAFFAKDGN
jgi:transposase-like protein